MIFELFALGGAVSIALAIFAIIVMLSDKPIKALLVALSYSYVLFFLYIYILNRIIKRKEGEKRY